MSNNSIFFGDNVPSKMAIDNSENIYITGKGTTIGNIEYDCFLVKYNSSGIKQWSNVYNGAASGTRHWHYRATRNAPLYGTSRRRH